MEKNKATIDGMRAAGKLASQVLDMIEKYVQPGITTLQLDDIMNDFILKKNAISACYGYKGYPRYTCISVNHVACHGIPMDYILKDGDILNIDVTVILDGMYGDTSRMYKVGEVSRKAQRICDLAKEAMECGIKILKPGVTTGDIGHEIQAFCKKNGVNALKDFCGHSIGTFFHGDIQTPSYGIPGTGRMLNEGDFITIEPILTLGKDKIRFMPDQWTVVMSDRALTAQWEHTIAITSDGYEIMTLS